MTKYIHEGEVVTIGKAIYKLANLDELYLRAYITGSQLTQIKLNQEVKVYVDDAASAIKEFPGIVSYISDKAEFTPKPFKPRMKGPIWYMLLKFVLKMMDTSN